MTLLQKAILNKRINGGWHIVDRLPKARHQIASGKWLSAKAFCRPNYRVTRCLKWVLL
jgi:hypothetical protein